MKDFWKKEGHKRKSKPSNKNIVIYFSAIISLYFLEKYNQYTLILAMILITAVILLCRNWRLIWAKVKNKNFERKNLKNLKYYFILDGKKRADLKKRKEIYSLFGDYAMHVALFFSLALVFIFDIARSVFHEVPFFAVSLSIGLSIIMILIFGGTILQIVYKFTTLTYVFIPAISCVIMNIFWESYFPASLAINLPDFAQISIYLVITIILYIMFSLFFPVYILRRLSERTALFSALVSILTSVAGQIFLFLSTRYFEGP